MIENEKTGFPEHIIDPREKGEAWHLQWCKAIWKDFNGNGVDSFYVDRDSYYEIADYMEGRQSITKYKPLMGVDEDASESWINVDWSVFAIVPKFVRICIGMLNKFNYKVRAKTLDAMAASDATKHFASQKAKMMLREQLEEVVPGMAKMLALDIKPGEAENEEELEMQQKYTWQHQLAIEIQQAIRVIFSQNNIDEGREITRKNLLYYGVAGWKDWIDSNGAIRIRPVRVEEAIVSFCRNRDFSDSIYRGEVLHMTIGDLMELAGDAFTTEQYLEIANNAAMNNTSRYRRFWRDISGAKGEKIRVMDIEWDSISEEVYDFGNSKGRELVSRAPFEKNGKQYVRTKWKVIHKAKWIVDTDYMFDWGMATNIKRRQSQLGDVVPNFHFFAPVFHEMRISSIGRDVIPIADQIQLDWLRFQQFKAEVRVDGYDIEIGALEEVSFSKGGKNMEPMELIDLFAKKGILMYRKLNLQGDNANYKPVTPTVFPGVEKALQWFNSIQAGIQSLRDVMGLNELTDASTPDPRTLTTIAELASQATNNNLYSLIEAEKSLLNKVAESVVLRIQDLAEQGHLAEYERAIGKNSVEFFEVSPKVSYHEFGIELVQIPTEIDKQRLIEDAKSLFGGDMVTWDDVVLIKQTDDLDVAERILAYRLEKRRKQKIEESERLQRQNAEVQARAAQAAEQAKQDTLILEATLKAQLMEKDKGFDFDIKQMQEQMALIREGVKNGREHEIVEKS